MGSHVQGALGKSAERPQSSVTLCRGLLFLHSKAAHQICHPASPFTSRSGPIVGSWREEVFNATGKLRTDFPETYRNVGVGGGDKWALAAAAEAQALSEWEEGGRKPLGE